MPDDVSTQDLGPPLGLRLRLHLQQAAALEVSWAALLVALEYYTKTRLLGLLVASCDVCCCDDEICDFAMPNPTHIGLKF